MRTRAPVPGTLPPSQVVCADQGPPWADRMTGGLGALPLSGESARDGGLVAVHGQSSTGRPTEPSTVRESRMIIRSLVSGCVSVKGQRAGSSTTKRPPLHRPGHVGGGEPAAVGGKGQRVNPVL